MDGMTVPFAVTKDFRKTWRTFAEPLPPELRRRLLAELAIHQLQTGETVTYPLWLTSHVPTRHDRNYKTNMGELVRQGWPTDMIAELFGVNVATVRTVAAAIAAV